MFPVPLLRPFTLRRWPKAVGGLALLTVFALGVYFAAVNPVILRLAARAAEISASLPGGAILQQPATLAGLSRRAER